MGNSELHFKSQRNLATSYQNQNFSESIYQFGNNVYIDSSTDRTYFYIGLRLCPLINLRFYINITLLYAASKNTALDSCHQLIFSIQEGCNDVHGIAIFD